MSLHVHHLCGCAPSPLALYLKAIGILRLVDEQSDPDARGWWQDEHFCLLTKLDQDELERFFLEKYSPTPFLSPWNKGSGFYKENDSGLSQIENSTAPRFRQFRDAIRETRKLFDAIGIGNADAAIRAIKARTKTGLAFQSDEQRVILRKSAAFKLTIKSIEDELASPDLPSKVRIAANKLLSEVEFIVSDADKPPTKAGATQLKTTAGYKRLVRVADKEFKRLKASLLPECRRLWRGLHARWMSAGVVLDENGEPQFPSLLGTGGNDGNLDFTNNAMLRLGELFDLTAEDGSPRDETAELLQGAFWSKATNQLTINAIGQFLPGSGGGANSSTGTVGPSLINAWDFVLMMEGAVPFSARATRRLDRVSKTKASAPFAVHAHAASHNSPGSEKDARGEQWLPLWSKPATMAEIDALLGDARLQLGRQAAIRPVDAARAISRLGVARGISAFTRYGFLERNGQATLAVPLGRIRVQHRPRASLIDDIAGWMNMLQRLARDSHAPARLTHAERRLADATFAVLTHDDTTERWQAVLEAAVDVESLQAGETALKAGPIPKLQPAWVGAIHDNTPEVRLALSIGSAVAGFTKDGRPFDPVRHHWLPLERGAQRFQISDGRLVKDPRVVMRGREAVADFAAIVARRLLEAEADSRRVLPLRSASRCSARLSDLAALIDGHVDLSRVLTLSRALMAIDWSNWNDELLPPAARSDEHPDEAWLALRLTCLPWPIHEGLSIPAEASLVSRLLSGDGAGAVRIASLRLGAAGIRLPFQFALADVETARLWAAALAFPISRYSARRAVEVLAPTFFGVSHA
jgi:CRISPR-associated protein Csx17